MSNKKELVLLLFLLLGERNDECYGSESKLIECPSPKSVLAQYSKNEVAEFDCIGFGDFLYYKITKGNESIDTVFCSGSMSSNKYDFKVKQNGIEPLNCTLSINITVLMWDQLSVQCVVGDSNSKFSCDTVNLTILTTVSSSPSDSVSFKETNKVNPSDQMAIIQADTESTAIGPPPTKTDTPGSGIAITITIPVLGVLVVGLLVLVAVALVWVIIKYCRCKKTKKNPVPPISIGEVEETQTDMSSRKPQLGFNVRPDGIRHR